MRNARWIRMGSVAASLVFVSAAAAAEGREQAERSEREGRERPPGPTRETGDPDRPMFAHGERLFDALDANRDGQINKDEFRDRLGEVANRIREARGAMPGGRPPVEEPPMKEAPVGEAPERRMNEMLERQVNEIVERRIHEIMERRVPEMIERHVAEMIERRMGERQEQKWPERIPEAVRDAIHKRMSACREAACPMAGRPGGFRPPGASAFTPPGPGPRGLWEYRFRGQTPPGPGLREPWEYRLEGRTPPPGPHKPGREPAPARGKAVSLFGGLDANHDGKLQAAELKRAVSVLTQALEKTTGADITPEQWSRITDQLRVRPPVDQPAKRTEAPPKKGTPEKQPRLEPQHKDQKRPERQQKPQEREQ